MAKKQAAVVLPKLTEAEQGLIWHMEHGYQLETDSLGGDPVLRRLKDDEVVRPASANRNGGASDRALPKSRNASSTFTVVCPEYQAP